MTTKKVSFGLKPTKTLPPAADSWVESRAPADTPPAPPPEQPIQVKATSKTSARAAPAGEREKMKRLTIDIPLSLHRAIKVQCAGRDTNIADEIRDLLLRKYGKS